MTEQPTPSLEEQLDAAYRERAHLVAWLAALHPAVIAPAPDVDEDGWQILYLTSSAYGWQMTWHIHPRDAELFKDVEHVPADDPRAQWDGHSTEQKYNRMRTHVRVVQMNNRLGATSCPVCEGSGRCPACHTTMRACPEGQRAEQLAATLREALDAFESYWARASYDGPGESAVQPEHFQGWRAILNRPQEPAP